MSEKYSVNIADIPLSIVSDEDEKTVYETVTLLDEKIREMNIRCARTSKLEAALVFALDAFCEKNKLKKRLITSESHNAFYLAKLNALSEENEKLKKMLQETK